MLIDFYTFYFYIFYSLVHSRMRRMTVYENHNETILKTFCDLRAIEDVSFNSTQIQYFLRNTKNFILSQYEPDDTLTTR